MALMLFRERNQVRWFGMRPAHRGTQVTKDATANGNYVDIYQPGAGEVACINTVVLSAKGAVTGEVGIVYTDSVNAVIAWLVLVPYITGWLFAPLCIVFPEPLELINQQKLRAYSSIVGCNGLGFCKGRVE